MECKICKREFDDIDEDIGYCLDCLAIEFQEMGEKKVEEKKSHPLYLIPNLLNSTKEQAKSHSLSNAHSIRNFLETSLKNYFDEIERLPSNILVCKRPHNDVSNYDATFIKILGVAYPKKIMEFQVISNILMEDFPIQKDDERTPLQRFCRLFVSKNMSESCKQVLYVCHIDFIFYNGEMWTQRYTGYKTPREAFK